MPTSPYAGNPVLAHAQAALTARQFERAVELSQAVLAKDMTNAEAQRISHEAQSRLEAQPFVLQFIEKARQQRASGNETAAKATIEKAKALDPAHPDLLELEKSSAAAPLSFDFGGEASPFSSAFSPAEHKPVHKPEPLSVESPFEASAPPPEPSSDVFDSEPDLPPARPPGEANVFGFTFEEEQKPPASVPAAPKVIPGSSGTFDFSTASVEISDEEHSKIGNYLTEGDQAFEAGEFQRAIDLWSRIFLIDVTHEEASARIEKARARRVEIDKKVDELVQSGIAAFERGDSATARPKFDEALRLDPTNFTASEYLEKISSGEPPPEVKSIPLATRPTAGPPADLFAEEFADAQRSEDSLVPPSSSARPRRPYAPVPAPARSRNMMPLILVVVVGLLVLGAGGWFAMKMISGGDGAPAPTTDAAFTQAQSLAASGQYDAAIRLLSAIQASDPQYDRALAMIADLQKKKGQTVTTSGRPGRSFAEFISEGQTAFAAHDYLKAKQALDQAAMIQPLPPDALTQLDAANRQVTRLQSASVLFKEGNYREALGSLELLQQQDPANQNVRQMISDAHFNLGQIALQEEKTQEAISHFDQVLAANPADELARRSRELASRYNNERKDLLYRIFVKYLPQRGV